MRIRRVVCTVASAAMIGGVLGLAAPAQAGNATNGLTMEVTRSGASPIVSGAGTTTEFTVVVTNPANNTGEQPVNLQGTAESGLTMVKVESVNNRLDCVNQTTYFQCTAYGQAGIESADPQNGGGAPMLVPGESATVKVTYTAEAWVPTSTKTFCSGLLSLLQSPPNEILASPCGIQPPDAAPLLVEPPSPWIEKTATVDVRALADLELTASGASQTDPGKEATVSFSLKDLGPSLALGHKISFTLPDGLSLVSAGPAPWKCTQTGQKVECVWELPVAAAAVTAAAPSFEPLVVKVKVPNPATKADYGITATATSNVEDPTPANATSTGGIPVTPVDLAVVKSAGSPVFVGDEATYTVDVSNVGTIDDLGKVTVVDTLPAGATFVSASGAQWTCAASGQKVTCTDDDPVFAAGTSEKITVVARMTAAGSPENKVEVSTTAYEKNLANNSSTKVVRVTRAAQTAAALPNSPRRILSGKTDQGQKLTTRVRCTPVKASVAGEVSYCKVTKGKGVVRVKVFGSSKMKVKVVQTAKGNAKLRPFVQRKTYIVKP